MVKVEKTTGKITGRCSSSAHLGFQNGGHFQCFLAYIYISRLSKQIKREALNLGEEENGFAR